jgi:cell division protease FtsH
MSDALGPLRLGQPQGEVFLGRDFASTPDYSDDVAARIDAEVQRLVEHAHDVARQIIQTNRAVLDTLAAELVERETCDVERVRQIFSPVEPFAGGSLGRPSAAAASDTTVPNRRARR